MLNNINVIINVVVSGTAIADGFCIIGTTFVTVSGHWPLGIIHTQKRGVLAYEDGTFGKL